MISFVQEIVRTPEGSPLGFLWVGLLSCDACFRHVRRAGPTLPTPDALPPMRQLLQLRQAAREGGFVSSTASAPGDYCARCVLAHRPASNDALAAPALRLVTTCQNCNAPLPAGRRKYCADKCEAEARGERVSLLRQNERGRPRLCPCGAWFRSAAKRGFLPQRCHACRARRKR